MPDTVAVWPSHSARASLHIRLIVIICAADLAHNATVQLHEQEGHDMADGSERTPIGSWDLSQERQFMENLLCQRFNFFIVLFSLVIAGAASANTQPKLVAILWIGFTLCSLVGLTVYRNFVKLIWILRELHAVPGHPVRVAGEGVRAKYGARALFGVNPIIGIVMPVACSTLLLIGAIAAMNERILANEPTQTNRAISSKSP